MKIWHENMAGPKKKSESFLNKKHVCEYCGSAFVRETTLAAHNCETKRRMAQENETGVRIGFRCFQKFYQSIKPSEEEKSYRNFVDSPYYLAFVKFGRYCVEIRAVDAEALCTWLLKNNHKLDNWTKDSYYDEFLVDYLRREPAAPALERSIKTMTEWAEEKQSRFQDYFKYATENRVCFDIQRGQISPWIVYTTQTGQNFLDRLDEKNLDHIWKYIDSDYWTKNFSKRTIDFEWAKELVGQAGL